MSASPSRNPGAQGAPIAGPPPAAPASSPVGERDARNRARVRIRVGEAAAPEAMAPPPWWTPEALKGWAGSAAMHALFLVALAFWTFAPSGKAPLAFDSRLAGSPEGVPEGESLAGGLNTPLPMPEAPIAEDQAGFSLADPPLAPLDAPRLEPDLRFRSNQAASGGGGRDNDNPGAGVGDGFGLARFGEGGEVIRGVQVKVGDPQFTLIWNNDVDLDLHVVEPGGKEIYWEEPRGERGGELDVDNTKGYGPENVYWLVETEGPGSEKVKGPGPPGEYRWWVFYWGGFGGISKPTHWQVRVKHAGRVDVYHGKFKALNEKSKVHTLKVEPPPEMPGP